MIAVNGYPYYLWRRHDNQYGVAPHASHTDSTVLIVPDLQNSLILKFVTVRCRARRRCAAHPQHPPLVPIRGEAPMLASSPAKSPRLHSSPSSTSALHCRRTSTTSSYGAHQNVSPPPRITSLRKAQNSPVVRTSDASTQYSPREHEPESTTKDPSSMADASLDGSTSQSQNITEEIRRPSGLVPESPSMKRLQPSDPSREHVPQKRAKAEASADTKLPARYDLCDVKDLVVMLSSMIADLVTINDPNQRKKGQLTRFHSREAPKISAKDYLQRLTTHLALQPVILLTMCFYMDRLSTFYSDFTVNSLTCHRFLITAATVATKGLSDSFWNNSTYARVGGVKLSELALLELEFLYRVDWRIIPENGTLVSYYHGLITRTDGYALTTSPPERLSDMRSGSDEGSGLGSPLTSSSSAENPEEVVTDTAACAVANATSPCKPSHDVETDVSQSTAPLVNSVHPASSS